MKKEGKKVRHFYGTHEVNSGKYVLTIGFYRIFYFVLDMIQPIMIFRPIFASRVSCGGFDILSFSLSHAHKIFGSLCSLSESLGKSGEEKA